MKSPKVKTRDWAGAALQAVCSVEEMRAKKDVAPASKGHGLGIRIAW